MFTGFDSIDTDITNLSSNEIERCRDIFSSLDREGLGNIGREQLTQALDRAGYSLNQEDIIRVLTYIDVNNRGQFDYSDFLKAIIFFKNRRDTNNENDYVDAFVAMGGNEDKSGKVDARRLVDVIKNEFDLTIDIEKLIREVDTDGSGEIEYNEFKAMLSH